MLRDEMSLSVCPLQLYSFNQVLCEFESQGEGKMYITHPSRPLTGYATLESNESLRGVK